MPVTLDDVAARAGVSRALVSLALRNSSRVAARSRERVLAAAEELGYRPNLNARRLASAHSGTVGVLISDLHNPLFAEILDGLADGTEDRPEQLILASGFRDVTRERAAVESFLAHRVDAVVLVGTQMPAPEIEKYGRVVPTVVIGRRIRGLDSVVIDDRLGARLVTEHLISLGHQRIAHVDGGKGAGAATRRRAYADTMRTHGLEQHIQICPGEYTEEAGRAGFEQLYGNHPRPTAIFAANDLSALGVLSGARAVGVDVPSQLSVAGFDNTTVARSGFVSLTTVDYPRAQAGEIASKLLQARLSDEDAKTQVITLTPTLVPRATTSAVRASET
ncbi:LacI family DNA-binding transcriptional regulator [Rhodococcus sp. NPDC127530]|uniref:LacI family DNA-binding transcriptional regulator n=1 Tax=unclassified Rhodococcus (in: high G+C Gram-positive bacteria) TaxID=192944 RepID=UPI0036275F9C